MRKEAFKSKGYTGVDVVKVTQTLPVCKGTKTGPDIWRYEQEVINEKRSSKGGRRWSGIETIRQR